MIDQDNLKKGNIVLYGGKPKMVYKCGKDELWLKEMDNRAGCYHAYYEDMQPIPVSLLVDRLNAVRGVDVKLIRNGFYCIEYIGDTFVCKYLHSFQNQFKGRYAKDFPIHKLYIDEIYK